MVTGRGIFGALFYGTKPIPIQIYANIKSSGKLQIQKYVPVKCTRKAFN